MWTFYHIFLIPSSNHLQIIYKQYWKLNKLILITCILYKVGNWKVKAKIFKAFIKYCLFLLIPTDNSMLKHLLAFRFSFYFVFFPFLFDSIYVKNNCKTLKIDSITVGLNHVGILNGKYILLGAILKEINKCTQLKNERK